MLSFLKLIIPFILNHEKNYLNYFKFKFKNYLTNQYCLNFIENYLKELKTFKVQI